jgi:hypothetical protein
MTGITMYLSILTMNVSRLNSSIKRHWLANWIKKEDPKSVAHRRSTSSTEINTGWEWKAGRRLTKALVPRNRQGSNTYLRQSRLQTTLIKHDKEGHFIIIKGGNHQKEITIINLYASNVNAPNFIKHTQDLKTYIQFNTVVVGDFYTPHHQ